MTYEQFKKAVNLNERITFLNGWLQQYSNMMPDEFKECCSKEIDMMQTCLKIMIECNDAQLDLKDLTSDAVTNALSTSNTNREASRKLGISERTLYRYLNKHTDIISHHKKTGRPRKLNKHQ